MSFADSHYPLLHDAQVLQAKEYSYSGQLHDAHIREMLGEPMVPRSETDFDDELPF